MESLTLFVLVIAVLAAVGGAAAVALRDRARKSRERAMSKAICQYFKKIGANVSVDCRLSWKNRYTAYIESEPIKQLRMSHVIECSLRDQLHNLHRVELEKVYWRFPIKDGADAKLDAKDDYLTEGLAHTRYLPRVEAAETTWETFEEAGNVPVRKRNT